MDLTKYNINSIILIQNRFRFIKYQIKKNNDEIENLYNIIFGLMRRIHSNFESNIIPQYKYNNFINKLDSTTNKFKELPRPVNFSNLKDVSNYQISEIIKYIRNDLKNIAKETGCYSIFDTIELCLDSKYFVKNDKLLYFYNRVFIPTSYCLYKLKDIKSDIKKIINQKELTIFNPNQDTSVIDIKYYDINNIINITIPTCKPLKKKISSIIEHINGTRLYLPLKNNDERVYLVMNGYFSVDPLNISRLGGTIGEKNKELVKLMKNVKLNNNFKEGFIEQLSLRDFLSYTNKELINMCYKSFEEVSELKNKTISSLVKEFVLSNVEKQRKILTLFLLLKDDIETQYLAHLMYDMISNETYLLKPQPLAEQVYNSLHWSIQKLFKIALKKVSDYTKKLVNINEEDLPYEKRICLLKAPDYVKSKAMDKYKEVINKGNDNSAKCQQYLDGLLKIPFEIYKKESIIIFLNNFKKKINQFINDILIVSNSSGHVLLDSHYYTEIKDISKKYQDNIITSENISIYLSEIGKLVNNILKEEPSNIDINDTQIINDVIETFDRKNKIQDYKNIIKLINSDLKNINSDQNIPEKGRKKDLKNNIYNLLINLDDIILKRKYLCLLQNMKLDLSESNNLNNEDNLPNEYNNDKIQKYHNLNNQWLGYKKRSIDYLDNVENLLNKSVYGQDTAKLEIKRIIAQWINGEMKGYCFGFEGPPGTGKTSMAKKGISECLKDENGQSRPFAFIAMGGSSNGSTLEGHSYTYVGSTWGKIVDILIETQCLNPIIFIDELDKISKTENGREIIGILTHLTDATQNEEFMDKYFSGIKIDLSKALFIFSYNDFSLIDPILADRIHRVKFHHLSNKDKVHIIQHYILPELLQTVGFSKGNITISQEVIEFIINNYTFEAGIRKLKEKVFELVREINLRYLTNKNIPEFPIKITKEIVENIFSKKPKMIIKKIAENPHVGLVNGLYATSAGVGGLTIIETFKTISDNKLSLILTGQQGDVMQESVKCAKTIAWNIIPNEIRKNITKEWSDTGAYGIHVHCPEAATPKDGPSAGGAITLAIVSLLCNIPVNNTIALTGEIDLNGSIHAIGGLDFKIEGGKLAGVKTILCPKQNIQELEIIKKEKKEILENIDIIPVDNIWEILKYCLVENNINFNKYV
jgi:ATP-dependent Lon protease